MQHSDELTTRIRDSIVDTLSEEYSDISVRIATEMADNAVSHMAPTSFLQEQGCVPVPDREQETAGRRETRRLFAQIAEFHPDDSIIEGLLELYSEWAMEVELRMLHTARPSERKLKKLRKKVKRGINNPYGSVRLEMRRWVTSMYKENDGFAAWR